MLRRHTPANALPNWSVLRSNGNCISFSFVLIFSMPKFNTINETPMHFVSITIDFAEFQVAACRNRNLKVNKIVFGRANARLTWSRCAAQLWIRRTPHKQASRVFVSFARGRHFSCRFICIGNTISLLADTSRSDLHDLSAARPTFFGNSDPLLMPGRKVVQDHRLLSIGSRTPSLFHSPPLPKGILIVA